MRLKNKQSKPVWLIWKVGVRRQSKRGHNFSLNMKKKGQNELWRETTLWVKEMTLKTWWRDLKKEKNNSWRKMKSWNMREAQQSRDQHRWWEEKWWIWWEQWALNSILREIHRRYLILTSALKWRIKLHQVYRKCRKRGRSLLEIRLDLL